MENVKLMNMCKIVNPVTKEILVQERVKSWQGIAFPGGKIEIGESIVSSVKREVYEETGLELGKIKICGIKDWYDKKLRERQMIILFESNDFKGNLLSETYEGKVYWVSEDELRKMRLAEDFDKLLDIYNNEYLNEMVYIDNENDDENTRWAMYLY